jgi:hypothetical protein
MVMPQHCVAMTTDEMTYVEGGISIPNWLVGGAINWGISFIAGGIGGVGVRFFAKQAASYGKQRAGVMFSQQLKNKLLAYGIASGIVSGVCGLMTAAFEILMWATDPGGKLVGFIDARDRRANNGWIDF